MASAAIDSYKLLTALKATGKDANYSAEELANAVTVAQEGSEILTKPTFDVAMTAIDARFKAVDARFDALESKFDARFGTIDVKFDSIDTKFDSLRADIKAEVKSSQLQNLLWLSGIVLASNGAVIALLARATKLF